MTFRTRLFLTSLVDGGADAGRRDRARLVVGSPHHRAPASSGRSISQARLAAETLSHRQAAANGELDAEADALGALVGARVTFVAPDGAVVGDSELDGEALATVENHGERPEIQQARRDGLGIARRYSTTVRADMLYVAVPVTNASVPALGFVRLALPLTDVAEQLAAVRRIALVGLRCRARSPPCASRGRPRCSLSRRVRAIAAVAERYAARGLVAPGARLRHRRDRHRRARARRLGAGDRPARRPISPRIARAWKRSSAA